MTDKQIDEVFKFVDKVNKTAKELIEVEEQRIWTANNIKGMVRHRGMVDAGYKKGERLCHL